ncbi:hypothetical protein [Erwinia phage vB_Ea277G]|nr:hypothetical protein [Erwinia phage vB_Ea277G]
MKVSLRAVLKPVLDFVTQFVNNTNNPTNVTAAQINAYTKTEIDSLLAAKLQLSDVPISYWGQSDTFAISVAVDSAGLKINTAVPSLLAGIRVVLPVSTLTITKTSGSTNFIYLKADVGALTYVVSATEQAESNTLMYLGKAVGTGTSATLTDFTPVIQIGGKRLSNTRRGNAIPVSNSAGNTSW